MSSLPNTASIDPRTLRPLFDAVYEVNAARDHPDFMSAVAAGMSRLIPADLCIVHLLDRTSGRLAHFMFPANPFTEAEIAYFTVNSLENPLIDYYHRTGDQSARRISEILPLAAWRATPYYRHTSARLGYDRLLGLPITVNADTVAGLSFRRAGRDFTQRHGALLDAFAPHFRLAWSRHRDPWARQSSSPLARERLRGLGLTSREAEILYWMTEGKQNREVALILGLSLQTVQKHVAHILQKMKQENRHAATVYALRYLGTTALE